MRSRYRIHEPHAAHFVTSTVVAWLPVFTTAARCDVLIQSWLHCREHKGLRIHGACVVRGVEPVLQCDPWRWVVAQFEKNLSS